MQVSRRQLLWGSVALPAFAKKTPPERPNLVLFLIDNLPSWVLGCYGNQELRTPNLDRLAQTGVRFANHFACSPEPALSRATFLSGRTPMQLGGSAGADVASRLLSEAGYATRSADIREAAAFLDAQTPEKPFCLTLGYGGLKPPYENVGQKYLDLYSGTKFDTLGLERAPASNARQGKERWPDIVASFRKVAAAVTALDDEVGAVVAKVSQKRLLDNTLFVLAGSCGSLYGRHGLWDAGAASEPVNMYDEAIETPMIWSWPGHVPAQAVRPELVSTYDFIPTLAELLLSPVPDENLCGRSYLPLATGKPLLKKQPWRTTVFGHYENTDMARIERYKLVMRDGGKGPGELYDLRADPGEKANQHANPQFLTVHNSLAQSLTAWRQRYSR